MGRRVSERFPVEVTAELGCIQGVEISLGKRARKDT